MTAFLIILHVLCCVFLILFVLLQPGARGGVGSAFGGAGGATVFGGRGANTFLAKLTAACAVVFMLTSISLSYFVSHTTSVMAKKKPAATAPADDTSSKDAKPDAKPAGSTSDSSGAKPAEKPASPSDAPESPPPSP